ncbi:MAG: hypothetical protein Q4P65_04030 [Eubacteriales bacterium]|nr:hypothetical protein [Eubacteriales bacterium]
MLFKKKIERAFKHLSSKKVADMTPEERAEYNAKRGNLEKGDLLSMNLAAWLTILPLALLVLLLIAGVPLLLIWIFG